RPSEGRFALPSVEDSEMLWAVQLKHHAPSVGRRFYLVDYASPHAGEVRFDVQHEPCVCGQRAQQRIEGAPVLLHGGLRPWIVLATQLVAFLNKVDLKKAQAGLVCAVHRSQSVRR